MTLHDELFADGVEVLEDLAAVPRAGNYYPPGFAPPQEPVVFTAIVGAVDAGDELVSGTEFDRRRKVERLTLRPTTPIDWKLNGEVVLAGTGTPDGGAGGRWQVTRITGATSRLPTVHLEQQMVMEQGRAGRKQR